MNECLNASYAPCSYVVKNNEEIEALPSQSFDKTNNSRMQSSHQQQTSNAAQPQKNARTTPWVENPAYVSSPIIDSRKLLDSIFVF